MALTIGAILALLSIAVAVYPFIGRRFFASREAPGLPQEQESLAAQLEAIYDTLRTLQLERELGNIPDGLYREQLAAYRWQAARLLREQDRGSAAAKDQEGGALEAEIRVARAALYDLNRETAPYPNCARPAPAGAGHCAECGVELEGKSSDGQSPRRPPES